MQQVRERPKGESAGRVAVETMGDRDRGDHDGESLEPNPSSSPKDNSPLFKRMTAVMHVIIFLYSAAFWVQTNVFPVGVLHASVYMCMCLHLHSHCCVLCMCCAYYCIYRVCICVTLMLVSYSVLQSVTLCALDYKPVLLNFCLN